MPTPSLRRRPLLLETIEDRILCSAVPAVAISAPPGPLVGEQIQLSVAFDNAHPTDTGFGPYVDVMLPATGVDGAGAQTDDGISFVNGSATYLGSAVTTTVLAFDAGGNATHPYAKDASGNSLVVTGTPGDQLVVFQLPFGSFAPTQPAATINFSANVSDLADVGTGLNIQARGGFQYGNDALDNPSSDPSLVGSLTSTAVTPQLFTLTKTYLGPEDETATGPNFLRQYRITVDIADGQTLTNLDLTDALPGTLQYVSTDATTIRGTPTSTTSVSTPGTSTPGGTLTRRFASVTGTTATNDAELLFTYFVPRIDNASVVIVNATSGNDVALQNNARSSGTWVPIDARDTGSIVTLDPAGPEHTLTAKSIATQKSVAIVADTGAAGATPGDTLEYTVQIQVSDYFAFQNLVLTDLISDGQRWDSTFTPTMSWNEHGGAFGSVALGATNYNVAQNFTGATASAPIYTVDPAANDGTTTVSFRVSDEMVTRGQDGKLIGGGIPNGGTGVGALPNNPALPFGATTVTVKFRAVIQDSFSDTYASGEAPLNPRDVLDDTVTIAGDLLQVNNVTTTTGQSEADDSAASIAIVNTAVSKTIYAINGSTNLAPFTGPGGELLVGPADTVTYRLQFTVPTGDIENLTLNDYLPLPVFNATQVTAFQDTISAAVPAAGFGKFGPSETLRALTGVPPTISTNATNNLVTFNYGTADDPSNTPRAVDLLFTVTVGNQPFADGLFLTNQVQVSENNTQQPAVAVVSDAIVQIQLQEPAVVIAKGVVGYNTTGLTLGGIAFSAASAASSFTGTVSSLAQAAAIGASDLPGVVDAGDEVRYAIVVQNSGRNDAFDVSLTDAVVPGYTIPGSLAAMNLVVRRGDGTLLTSGVDYTASINGAGALSVALTDNYTSGNSGADTDSGALSRGFNANTGTDITNGSNTVVITYDLTLQTSTPHTHSTLLNTATLTNYAGSEGGPDFTTVDVSDSATVQLASPTVAKALTATEITTGNNSATQAVVGELVTYTLTVTVPEGTTPSASLVDTMASGLGFVDVLSVSNSTGVATSNTIGTGANPTNVTVGGSGSTLTFNFGNIVNSTSNNGTTETITIVYRAAVLDTLGNQAGTTLANSAVFSAQAIDQPYGNTVNYSLAAVAAANVTVIEPALTVAKLVGSAAGGPFAATLTNTDAGDAVFYQIQIAGTAGQPTAFELYLNDTLPSYLTGAAIASVVTSGFGATPAPVAADFQISGGVLNIDATGPRGGNIDVPAGATITLVFGGTLSSATQPGLTIANTATVRWSSMDGSVGTRSTHTASSTERSGGSLTPATGVNASTNNAILDNYAATSASGAVAVLDPVPTKTVDSTSESGTGFVSGAERVAIGEIIRYRLVWRMPEGTSNNLAFTDQLPAGMQFLNDGTTTLAFVSTGGTINSSIGTIGAGASVTGDETTLSTINPQFVIPSAQITGGAFVSGTDPIFTLGNVVNNDSDANQEFAVIEFNAIVRNETVNQRYDNSTGTDTGGVNLDNTVRVTTTSSTQTSAVAQVRVAEPNVTDVTKTISAGPYDAGDIVTYTVTFSNLNATGAAPAYDLALNDVVPGAFDTVTFGSITATGTTTGLSGSAAGNTITASVASMNPGATVTVTFTARLLGNTPPSQLITNTANLTYSSLSGSGTALDDGVAATTNSTPGAAGTATGERTGTGGAGTDAAVLNNYADSGSVGIAAANPTIDKAFKGGSITADDTSVTSSSGATVVVGEQVTYDILVTLTEGTTQALNVIDAVPAGLRVDGYQILTTTATATQLAADFAGSFGSTPTLGSTFTGAGNLTLNFGNTTVTSDNDTTNNSFVIRLTGTVLNIAGNVTGATRANTATLQFTNPNNGSTTTITDGNAGNNPVVTVAEPALTIGKTVNSATVDAGDALSYTITIGNASGQTAYNVSLSDVLPASLTGATVASVTKSGAGTIFVNGVAANPGAGTDVIISGGTLQFAGGSNIDLGTGTTLQIVVSGTAASNLTPNQTVNNTATTTWTSTDGGNADERTGSGGALNPYAASSSIPFTVPVASITKALFSTSDAVTAGSNIAIGEIATYALTVTLPEGTAPNLIVTDALPPGLQYVSSSIVTTGFAGTLPAPTITGGVSNGDDVTFTFGSISTTGDNNAANNSFTIYVTARALDVVGNAGTTPGQTSLANSATLDITGDGVSPATTPNVTTTVVEPRLQIIKAVDDNTPDIGQTLGYTLTIQHTASSTTAANDVLVRDAIPAGLALDTASIRINGVLIGSSGLVAANASTSSALDFRLTSVALASTVTVTYNALLTNSVATTGLVLDNNARIYWDSLAGYDGNNSVLSGTPDAAGERDFGATPAYTENPTPGVNDPAQDTERVTVNSSGISGFVYRDNDSSGTRTGGDTAIAGVTVTLTGTSSLGLPVNATTTSAADGSYSFIGLPPGTYLLAETQPASYMDGLETRGNVTSTFGGTVSPTIGSNTISAIVIPGQSNVTEPNYNFGETLLSSLAGSVYLDADNDGLRDVGETPLAGIPIALTGTDIYGQAVTANATTDVDGHYLFSNLRPGNYTLSEDDSAVVPSPYLDGKDTPGSAGGAVSGTSPDFDMLTVTLLQATAATDYDFAEVRPSSLAGAVYHDADNDGVFDAGESAITGATVTLTGTDDRGAAVNTAVLTDASGAYVFSVLRPGTYTITETQPAGYLDGKETIGTPGGVTVNDQFHTIALAPGISGTANNFGELLASSLSGTVYRDLDNDGAIDAGETGIAGVTVTLTGTDDRGAAVNTAVLTNASGAYTFGTLRPGNYTITETQAVGFNDGKDTQGTPSGGLAVNDAFQNITVVSNTNGTANNFGELPFASVSGTVFSDLDNDGVRDGGESGLAGVTMRLVGTNDLGAAVNVTIATDGSGNYTFAGLRPGTYTVSENAQPVGYLDGIDTPGNAGGTAGAIGTDSIGTFTIVASQTATAYNFGEVATASLSGNVYRDLDNDGVRDAGETGISGVTITLTGTNDLGAVALTGTTALDGSYSFVNLRPGIYTIAEAQPAGFNDGKDTQGTPGGGTAINDAFQTVTLNAGVAGTENNFGELPPSTVSGTVYRDFDNDGVIDAGETFLNGVQIALSGTDDLGAAVNATATTNASGAYSFTGLRPGVYAVAEVTQPAGLLDGRETPGPVGGTAGGIGTDTISAITLPAATVASANNFGELRPASLAGFVYDDLDNDGGKDTGENGIGGVTVTLTGTNDQGVLTPLTTTTAADGSYSFGDLRPGTYTITQIQPGAFNDGKDTLGTGFSAPNSAGSTGNDVFSNIVIASVAPGNETGVNYNFGELRPASLAGSVYFDADGNGVRGGGETGLQSVNVALTGTDDRGNAVSLSALTGVTGAFSFTNLRPGTYTLTETQPAAYQDGGDALGTLGGSLANDAFSNIAVPPGANGVNYTFGERNAGIAGAVFIDRNTDGTLDPADTGRLSGVTVRLRDSGGSVIATMTTASDGTYFFGDLLAGDYTVEQTQPGGYGSSTTNLLAVTMPATGLSNVNFGETTGSLAGTVFVDADASGALNGGDSGLGGVLVTLTGTDANGAAVNRTATTAADGTYLFTDLLGGTYVLQESQPALYTDGAEIVGSAGGTLTPTDRITAIPFAAAGNATGYNFGELVPVTPGTGAIRGTVYVDADKGATFDLGENGVSGVTVTLRDNLGNTVATTTTNSGGAYSFNGLAPGDYTVVQTQPLAYGSSTPNILTPISVTAGVIADGQDFGETYGSLEGFVYVDANDNAARESGETPIPGATVTLTGTDINGAAVNRTTTTAADGSYRFTQLLTGTYTLTETQPAAYSDGQDALGTAGGTLGSDVFSNIGLGGGIDATSYNFGELSPALRGTVFVDADRDGVRDSGETGIGGVTLTLRDSFGADIATTTTAADGTYSFTGIAAGTYTVIETQPSGYGSSTTNARTVSIPAAGLSNVDFGETTATLAGRVYVDSDASGDFTTGETLLSGVTVTLTGTDATGAAVNRTTTTAVDGTYLFDVLLAGNYTVTETQPSGYTDGPDNLGSVGGVNSANDTFSSVPVGGGVDATGYDFGEFVATPPGTGTVAGTVYRDADKDGVLDGSETGIGGVTLTLLDNLGATVGTTTTNPDGSYLFTGITPGAGYQVVVTQPPGYAPSSPLTLSGLTVTAGNVTANHNFGETTGSLAGRVFRDDNNNGVQNGSEPGLAGVTVTLTGADVNGAIAPIVLTTAADGSYSFTGLLGGTYTVTEKQPVAYGDGLDSVGSTGGTLGADTISTVGLGAGVDGTGYNFGELGARITGTVFGDDNSDGSLQLGELGIGSVTLQLRDNLGVLVATTTTLPGGTYAFEGLAAGNYTVVEIQPAAYGSSTPNSVAVVLPTGGTGVADFGEITGSISGVVYHDRNHDGVIDAGEPLLAGVTVTLTGTDVTGAAVNRVTTTLGDGSYTFNSLPAGTYTLIETQAVGYSDGRETLGSVGGNPTINDRISGIGLGAGADETGYLFGERIPTDLVTTKTDNLGTVRAGQLITYTITVSNVSLQQVEGLLVTDQFPTDVLEFVSASNGGVFNATTGTITWNLGQLASAGGNVTLTIDARVRTPVPALVERITNRVTATDTLNPGADPTPRNNTASDVDDLPGAPDLYVVKTTNITTAKAGETITYTLTGGNSGDQSAAQVIVSDSLPPGLRFVSATNGGRLVGNSVQWDLGTLVPGETFTLSVTVVVEQTVAGNFVNTATITDASEGFEDPTPQNNTSSVPGEILAAQTFAFDGFNNFAGHDLDRALDWRVSSPEVLADAILPLQPIYSGEADPGSTLLIELFSSRGAPIGSQTVVTDTGGNWLATFPSTILKDAPNTARITQIAASYSLSDPWGHNLRTYFTPAINTGHFFLESRCGGDLTGEAAPLLGGLGIEQPLQLGVVKYGGEFLTSQSTASGR